MAKLVTYPSSTALWQELVAEAGKSKNISLNHDLESYLVFLLMRGVDLTCITNSLIAVEFLSSINEQDTSEQKQSLQEIGDKCLLLTGMFPQYAHSKNVRASYFISIGKTAYCNLSERHGINSSNARLFNSLSDSFVAITDLLNTVRDIQQEGQGLDPLSASEIWEDTGSIHAFNSMANFSENPDKIYPIIPPTTTKQ